MSCRKAKAFDSAQESRKRGRMMKKTSGKEKKRGMGGYARALSAFLCMVTALAVVMLVTDARRIAGVEPPPEIYFQCDNTALGSKSTKLEYHISVFSHSGDVAMSLHRIDMNKFMKTTWGYGDESEAIKDMPAPIKEWTLKVKKDDKNYTTELMDTIENPGPGFYFVVARIGEQKRAMPFFVSDISLITKRDGEKTIFFVQDRFTGAKISGVEITALKGHEVIFNDVTNNDGVAVFQKDGEDEITALADWKGHVAFLNVYTWWFEYFRGHTAYTVTDRPVYRPGHTVQFKTTVRYADGAIYSMPKVNEVEIEIKDPKDNTLLKEKKPLNGFGSCAGELKLADEPPIGSYSIIVRADGKESYQSFMVEEYRKPEYEVTVTPGADVVIQGDKLVFDVQAKYYFGEPVKDADVAYEVTATPRYSWWWGYSRYSWYYDEEPYYYDSYYGGETIVSETTKTDAQGRVHVEVATKRADYDMTYRITAKVTDKSRREISGSGSAMAARAEFNMYLDTNQYMYSPADNVKVTATLRDHAGNPVADKSIDLVINRVEWDYKRNYERIEHKFLTKTIVSDKNGVAKFDFTPDVEGYFEISGSTKDGRNNPVAASTSAYVVKSGSDYVFWTSGGIEIVMDKDSYALGDTARALITTGKPGASVLVAVEAESVYDYAVLDMPEGSAVFEFEITELHRPNVYVSAALVQGDSYETQTENVVIPPSEKFLNLEITSDKKEYRPGDRANFSVKVTDNDGRAAPEVELSLGVVDESIYAIRTENVPDARQFFYGRRYNKVQSNCSLWYMPRSHYDYGRYDKGVAMEEAGAAPDGVMMEPLAAPMPKSANGKKDGEVYAEAEIRTDFRDTATWEAFLVTDKDGTAHTSFTLPDSLTTWRATARGVSKSTQVGNGTSKTIVRKNLIVRLETPRFFTQDDEQNITAVVHNYLSEAKKVKCQLTAKGMALKDGGDKYIDVPAGGDARVEWHGTVQSPQEAWVTVKALTDEESDAMQLTIPVLAHGVRNTSSLAGEADINKTETIKLPANSVKGASTLRLSFAPSIASTMFESLDYLVGYPYGCVEQTMSRFLPDVVVEQAMQKLGLPKSEKMAELPKMVAEGLQRLTDFQHDDGGWGWWENDTTHPFMTAYVIYGVSQAQRADYPVDADMLARGIENLKTQAQAEKNHETLSYMLFALSEAGVEMPDKTESVYKKYKKLNAYSQALLALTLLRNGDRDRALGVIKNLEEFAVVTGTIARWNAPANSYSWMDNSVETTAFALKAMLAVDPDNKLIPKIVRWLNSSRNGDHWYSTKDTAAAVLALTDFMVAKENLSPDLEYTIKVNGKAVHTGHFTKADVFKSAAVVELTDLSGDVKPGGNAITITRNGEGKLYYTALLTYFEQRDKIQAEDKGIHISRYYSFDSEGRKKLAYKSVIKPGDEIYVHINVRPGSGREYVIIEDMLPSGFEVVKEEYDYPYWYGYWSWWYPQKEIRDERVIFFATNMYENSYDLSYRIRAEVPGKVTAMPAVAWLMYFPDLGGHSDEHTFTIIE